jgi:diguanylate cyclase (GGDEF)-like protein
LGGAGGNPRPERRFDIVVRGTFAVFGWRDLSKSLVLTIRTLVALACMVIALLYAWQVYEGWRATGRETAREAVNLAESLAQQTGSSFETTDAVLQRMYFWAQTRGVAPPQRKLLNDLLSVRTPSMAGIGELAFFDAAGNRVVRSGPPVTPEIGASERRAFAWHATHPSLDPFVVVPSSWARGRAAITLSRRFNDGRGRFAGMVIATIRVASVVPWYDTVDVGRDGLISLILTDGTIIVRKPAAAPAIGTDERNNELSSALRSAPAGNVALRSTIDGRDRLVAFRRVNHFPLIVIVGFGADDTFAQWRIYSLLGLIGVFGILATIVLLARGLIAELRRSARAQARLSYQASTDGLTGLANRRELDGALEREWKAALAKGSSIALLMIDIDHFKAYNDTYGHLSGDEALKQVATTLRQQCRRAQDVVARYGGEEFVVLLPSTPVDGARILAEKLRLAVAECAIPHQGNEAGIVTISVGVSEIMPGSDNAPADLIRMADDLLYDAKRAGRNRVAVA